MGPKESKRDDTRSFLGGHGPTRILPVFLEKLSTRPKAVSARTRRALGVTASSIGQICGFLESVAPKPKLMEDGARAKKKKSVEVFVS